MKASEWIDEIKALRGWPSDYKVAKELGVSRNTISMYRTKTPTMDEETAVAVADALDISPGDVVLDQVAERSRSAAVKEALKEHVVTRGDLFPPGWTHPNDPPPSPSFAARDAKALGMEFTPEMESVASALGRYSSLQEVVMSMSGGNKNHPLLKRFTTALKRMPAMIAAILVGIGFGFSPPPANAGQAGDLLARSVYYVKRRRYAF